MLHKLYKNFNRQEREESHIPNAPHKVPQSGSNKLLDLLLETQVELRKRMQEEIVFSPPIIEREGIGIIYPNTINIVQGKAGSHKSRLTELLASCLLCNIPAIDFLGFRKSILKMNDYSILYVDTERNLKDQYPYALKKMISKAGLSVAPNNFGFITLLNIPREKRFATLKAYLYDFKKQHPNHTVVVLDVLTDCLINFNDPKESLALVDLLNAMINEFDITFLCVIHENPGGGEKARGHVGTESLNKASTQIQVSIENLNGGDEAIKVKYLKTRRSKRPAPFYVYYSDSENGLILANDLMIEELEKTRKEKANLNDITDYLIDHIIVPVSRASLLKDLCEAFTCGRTTIIARLKEIIETPVDIPGASEDVIFHLVKIKEGKEIKYELQKQESKQEEELLLNLPSNEN